jgi:4-amino-4-deoxy-L-arabinose transferase-like glycosyltransferase
LAGSLLAGALLVVALTLGNDYGLSWDEADNLAYARATLRAYLDLARPSSFPANFGQYGPFFFSVATLGGRMAARLSSTWSDVDGRHVVYFLGFIVSVLAVYSLANRLTGSLAALVSALLFALQPLLFGHAFINAKDVPFMGLFAATIALGAACAARFRVQKESVASSARRMDEQKRERASSVQAPALALGTGVMLGLSTSTRIAGPLAGVLAMCLMFAEGRRRAIAPVALMWVTAAIACYATWPYLWGAPLQGLVESLTAMAQFSWNNLVLYQGQLWEASDLPWHFALFPLALQLTVPAVALSLIGILIAIRRLLRPHAHEVALVVAVLTWIAVPFSVAIFSGAQLYDNSRQLLFAFPAVFLVAALGIDWSVNVVRPAALRIAAIAAILLPGVVSILNLHPYEYVYYNELVGGVSGAFRHYELDYWATSYREAIERLNQVAPPAATVAVAGPWEQNWVFAREDLVHWTSPQGWEATELPDLAIFPTRSSMDLYVWSEAPVIATVEIDAAVLAVIRDLRPPP